MKIRQKLLIMFLAILIIPSSVQGITGYYNAKNGLEELTEKGLKNNVHMALEIIDMHEELVSTGQMSLEEAQEEVKHHLLGEKDGTGSDLDLDLGENGYFFILDQDGTFLAHPTLEGENRWDDVSQDGILYVQEIVNQGLNGGGFTYYDFPLPDDPDTIEPKVSYSKQDPNWGWIVSVGSYTHEYSEHANQLVRDTSLTLMATVIVGALAALFFAHYVSKPIQHIAAQAEQIANGHLAVSPLDVKTNDELGLLSRQFNKMLASLRKMIGQTTEAVQQVASTTDQLVAGSEQTSQAAEHISSSIQEVVSDAEAQADKTSEAAQIINDMVEEFEQISSQFENVTNTSQQTVKTAESGNDVVSKAENQMNLIGQSGSEMEKAIQELEERSNQIGDIISLITDIAEQTNLLALNASIEAARAGEHGRGFSVVAEEVRKLAEQAAKATDKVKQLIVEIQGDIQQTAQIIAENGSKIREGVQLTGEAGKSFQIISKSIHGVTAQIEQICAKVQQMNKGTGQLVQSMAEIEKRSQTTAGYAQNVAAATEEQTASMEEIASATQVLGQMAAELQQTVDGFKL